MIRSLLLAGLFMASGTVFSQNLKKVSYKDGTQKLNGLVTSNAGKKLPGVLILPAWMGMRLPEKRPDITNKIMKPIKNGFLWL